MTREFINYQEIVAYVGLPPTATAQQVLAALKAKAKIINCGTNEKQIEDFYIDPTMSEDRQGAALELYAQQYSWIINKREGYLSSKWCYSDKMFCFPLEELLTSDIEVINTLLLVPRSEILILSTLGYPGCIIYIESPYDEPIETLVDLKPCWQVFSKSFCQLVLYCQQHNYTWLRLCP